MLYINGISAFLTKRIRISVCKPINTIKLRVTINQQSSRQVFNLEFSIIISHFSIALDAPIAIDKRLFNIRNRFGSMTAMILYYSHSDLVKLKY